LEAYLEHFGIYFNDDASIREVNTVLDFVPLMDMTNEIANIKLFLDDEWTHDLQKEPPIFDIKRWPPGSQKPCHCLARDNKLSTCVGDPHIVIFYLLLFLVVNKFVCMLLYLYFVILHIIHSYIEDNAWFRFWGV